MLGRDFYRSDDNYKCIATNFYTGTSDEDPHRSEHVAFYKKKMVMSTLVI